MDGQTDGRTDAEGYNIIRPFFKQAYKKCGNQTYIHILVVAESVFFKSHIILAASFLKLDPILPKIIQSMLI